VGVLVHRTATHPSPTWRAFLASHARDIVAVGDRDFKFFIVKAGEIEILDHSGETPKTVVVHGKGQFTGDVSHLTGRASVIRAVARGECVVAEVSGDALRGALNQCPTLSDILLQAFIARRQLLRESGDFVGLRVIGSRYSTDTFRVRDFLAKNRALFTWLDVETHPEVGQLLQHFGMTEVDTPVVALGDLLLLRNPSNPPCAKTRPRLPLRRAEHYGRARDVHPATGSPSPVPGQP
jgi:thioredoxin reductase (NADPH)